MTEETFYKELQAVIGSASEEFAKKELLYLNVEEQIRQTRLVLAAMKDWQKRNP